MRSRVRYWIASLKCLGSIEAAPSKSEIVRDTLRIRSWARADSPRRAIADSNSFSPSALIAQCFRTSLGGVCAFA